MKKRIIALLLTLILAIITTVPAFGAGTVALLSADDVYLSDNKTVLVPVFISNNPGIMGFKVTASNSTDKLEITDVSAGNVTSKGNFITNAGRNQTNSIDIIWYSTEQTIENGSVFVLAVKPTKAFSNNDSAQINLSFSQADTFNEKYMDVELNCNPIVFFGGEKDQNVSNNQNTEQESSTEIEITDDQLIVAVDTALNNTNTESINDIDENTLAIINQNLKSMVGMDAPHFTSMEDLRSRYNTSQSNKYKEQAITDIDPQKMIRIFNDVLGNDKAKSFSSLDNTEKATKVKHAFQKFHESDSTLPSSIDSMTDAESAEMFDDLLKYSSSEIATQDTKNTDSKGEKSPLLIILITAFVLALGLFIVVIQLKKRQSYRDKTDIESK